MSDSTFERRAKEPDFPKPTNYKNRSPKNFLEERFVYLF